MIDQLLPAVSTKSKTQHQEGLHAPLLACYCTIQTKSKPLQRISGRPPNLVSGSLLFMMAKWQDKINFKTPERSTPGVLRALRSTFVFALVNYSLL